MPRRLLFLLSTILSLATLLLTIRSYWISDFIQLRLPSQFHINTSIYLSTGKGGIAFGVNRDSDAETAWTRDPASGYGNGGWRTDSIWKHFGLDVCAFDSIIYAAVVPGWLLSFLFALPLALQLHRRHKRRKLTRDPATILCPTCGYDQRATPTRCPECGTKAAGN